MKKSSKKPMIITAIIIIALIGLIVVSVKNQPKEILFYSNFCSYCKVVEKHINDNDVKSYLEFRELEVSSSQANSQLLSQKAARCGLKNEEIGVPLFYDGEKCLVGDVDIINYLESKKPYEEINY